MRNTNYFVGLARGDRDRAFEIAAARCGMLMVTADTTPISSSEFKLLAQLINGVETSGVADGRSYLLRAIDSALHDNGECRDDIRDEDLSGDQPATRIALLRDLDNELHRLRALRVIVENLDDSAALTLLYRIEEVYASDALALHDRCHAVYEKMQIGRQL